jgi:hypothetical protein
VTSTAAFISIAANDGARPDIQNARRLYRREDGIRSATMHNLRKLHLEAQDLIDRAAAESRDLTDCEAAELAKIQAMIEADPAYRPGRQTHPLGPNDGEHRALGQLGEGRRSAGIGPTGGRPLFKNLQTGEPILAYARGQHMSALSGDSEPVVGEILRAAVIGDMGQIPSKFRNAITTDAESCQR